MTTAEIKARSKAFVLASLVVFMTLVAVLVSAVDIPPVLDYPNHYVRIWLLSGGLNDPTLSQIYGVDWRQTSTNIGIDVLAWYLGPLFGADLVAKASLFLAIVLPPLGAALLNRYLLGRWHPWQVAVFFFAWCATMIGGFLNFQIGLGLALLFALVDTTIPSRLWWCRALWRISATAVLYFDHAFACAFFLLLVVALEFSAEFTAFSKRRAFWHFFRRALAAIFAWLGTLVCIWWFVAGSDVLPTGQGLALAWNGSLPLQLANFFSAIWSYVLAIDGLVAGILLAVVFICRRNGYRLHAGLIIATLILLCFSIAAPRNALGTGWISWRFPIMAALAAAVMFLPSPLHDGRRFLLVSGLVVLTVFGRLTWVGYNWIAYQPDVREVRDLLLKIPQGSAVLQVGHLPDRSSGMVPVHRYMAWFDDVYRHLATLAVPMSKSFVPTVFTARGKQPLVVKGQWHDIDIGEDNLISTAVLICFPPESFGRSARPYLSDWRHRFDYVLLVNADEPDKEAGFELPPGLDLVEARGFAHLYRIDKGYVPGKAAPRPAYCDSVQPWQ